MIRIGILGDIGSGKSYVAKNFGYPVFNADSEVSKIYKKNKKIFNKLKKKLPRYISKFPIDKNEVSVAILSNKNNLKKIINIVHLEVRKQMKLFLKKNKNKKIGLQIDTGLNRLGIQIKKLINKDLKNINLFILVSHFSSSEEISNIYNFLQNKKFKTVFNLFKSIKYISLSNSAGILNNKEFHYNLTRPGIFLYGGYQNKRLKKILKIKSVVKLKAKILQIKEIGANEYIGYNQTYKTKKTIKVAILGIGYGDGIFRILSNKGKVYFKKKSFRIIGRISMDSMTINITNCKHKICVGEYMEIINEDNDIEKIAKACSTISREILTSISRRVIRQYI